MMRINLLEPVSRSLVYTALSCVLVVAVSQICQADPTNADRPLAIHNFTDPQQMPLPVSKSSVSREPVNPSTASSVLGRLNATRRTSGPNVRTTGGFLLVLGGLLLAVWLTRNNRNAPDTLPTPVAELLGRIPFPNRQPLHLLRLGSKLVLIAAHGQQIQTVAEVTDPQEVLRLTELCRNKLGRRPPHDRRYTEEILQRVSQGVVDAGGRVAC